MIIYALDVRAMEILMPQYDDKLWIHVTLRQNGKEIQNEDLPDGIAVNQKVLDANNMTIEEYLKVQLEEASGHPLDKDIEIVWSPFDPFDPLAPSIH
ncbi:MAG TPA: hypothetical protein VJJ48_00765 [Candidatus Paceibacterota bacterium]